MTLRKAEHQQKHRKPHALESFPFDMAALPTDLIYIYTLLKKHWEASAL